MLYEFFNLEFFDQFTKPYTYKMIRYRYTIPRTNRSISIGTTYESKPYSIKMKQCYYQFQYHRTLTITDLFLSQNLRNNIYVLYLKRALNNPQNILNLCNLDTLKGHAR
jgi:hypothetical protein